MSQESMWSFTDSNKALNWPRTMNAETALCL